MYSVQCKVHYSKMPSPSSNLTSLFIVYSVITNKKVRSGIQERMSEIASTRSSSLSCGLEYQGEM